MTRIAINGFGRIGRLVFRAIAEQGLYEAVPTVSIHIVALVLSPAMANADHLGVLASMATLRMHTSPGTSSAPARR